MQHVGATSCNNVARMMLRAFGHHVAQCCVRLANPAQRVATWSDNVACNMLHPFGQDFTEVSPNERTSSSLSLMQLIPTKKQSISARARASFESLQCVWRALNVPCWFHRRSAFLSVVKIAKLCFTTVAYAQVQVVAEAMQAHAQAQAQAQAHDATAAPVPQVPHVSPSVHNAAVILQQALQFIPSPGSDCMVRSMAHQLAQKMKAEVRHHPTIGSLSTGVFDSRTSNGSHHFGIRICVGVFDKKSRLFFVRVFPWDNM